MPLHYLDYDKTEQRFKQDTPRLLGEFVQESFRLQASLEEAYYAGDRQKLRQVCGEFTARLQELCAAPLAALAEDLAECAKEGSDMELKDHVLRFRGCLRYLRMEIEAALPSGKV